MENGDIDITQLSIRMGQAKLLDLDSGYPILNKLNTASGDDGIFKIEMSGEDLKTAYDALPLVMRKELDRLKIFTDLNQMTDTLRDIDRTIKHMQEIEDRDIAAVEAYISITIILTVLLAVVINFGYNLATQDVRMNYPRYVSGAISMLLKNIYQQQQQDSPTDPVTMDDPASSPDPNL